MRLELPARLLRHCQDSSFCLCKPVNCCASQNWYGKLVRFIGKLVYFAKLIRGDKTLPRRLCKFIKAGNVYLRISRLGFQGFKSDLWGGQKRQVRMAALYSQTHELKDTCFSKGFLRAGKYISVFSPVLCLDIRYNLLRRHNIWNNIEAGVGDKKTFRVRGQ